MNFPINASLALVSSLFVACSSPTVKSTWKNPDHRGGGLTNIVVLMLDDLTEPIAMENEFRKVLDARGVVAVTGKSLGLHPSLKLDSAIVTQARRAGAQALLVGHELGRETRDVTWSQTTRPGGPIAEEWSASMFTLGQDKLALQFDVYLLQRSDRLWSSVTQIRIREDADPASRLSSCAKVIVNRMKTDGIIR